MVWLFLKILNDIFAKNTKGEAYMATIQWFSESHV